MMRFTLCVNEIALIIILKHLRLVWDRFKTNQPQMGMS